ncbi:MAG: glycosyltransferase [Acidimicrobiia bacterium]
MHEMAAADLLAGSGATGTPGVQGPAVDVVLPVYDEEQTLDRSVRILHAYLSERFPFTWRITIADNASTDGTWPIARRLAAELDGVRALHLDRKGRGLALRTVWANSDAPVVAYMDVDLSTDLDALLPLVAPLLSGHSDVAIGSRLASGSAVARFPKRELVSRTYNAILRVCFASRFRDAQCGFKAVRSDIARRLLPGIEDDGWFFDTELLLVAEHNDLRIHEVPVDWVDDPDSRVHVAGTAWHDLRGAARMARTFLSGRGRVELGDMARRPPDDDFGRGLVTFGIVGLVSTVISLAVFLLTRSALGAIGANALAVSTTFVANTWAHARYSAHRARPGWSAAFALYAVSLLLTSGALALVAAFGGGPGAEIVALVVTWNLAGVGRLALVRSWSGGARVR